jgi:hypothetical protein
MREIVVGFPIEASISIQKVVRILSLMDFIELRAGSEGQQGIRYILTYEGDSGTAFIIHYGIQTA